MYQCCGRTFFSRGALEDHSWAMGHDRDLFCYDCQMSFVNVHALTQHLTSSMHAYDDTYYCYGNAYYAGRGNSFDEEAYCEACDRNFDSEYSLNQHLAASSQHNWCFVCCKDFRSANALDQHNSSRVHNASTFKCLFCPRTFKVPSAITLHIESGACHNISRHQVTQAVHSLNISPTISISHRIAGPSCPAPQAITTYAASELAFNGSAYECYVCHKTFRSLSSLNSHLGSAAHDQNEFCCPNCRRKYTLISGLVQHIESEVCGLARFETVASEVEGLTANFSRMLTF